jgi:hypothetical protein
MIQAVVSIRRQASAIRWTVIKRSSIGERDETGGCKHDKTGERDKTGGRKHDKIGERDETGARKHDKIGERNETGGRKHDERRWDARPRGETVLVLVQVSQGTACRTANLQISVDISACYSISSLVCVVLAVARIVRSVHSSLVVTWSLFDTSIMPQGLTLTCPVR